MGFGQAPPIGVSSAPPIATSTFGTPGAAIPPANPPPLGGNMAPPDMEPPVPLNNPNIPLANPINNVNMAPPYGTSGSNGPLAQATAQFGATNNLGIQANPYGTNNLPDAGANNGITGETNSP